jgi:threonine dehydrogenase-like Zn-dependent dehydrogenase
MYAAVLTEYGKIQYKQVPTPAPKAGQVLIRIAYASICGSDIHIFKGQFGLRTPVPFIPGHEFAGYIEQVGQGVDDFTIGQQVAVDPVIWCGTCPACQRGHYPACNSLKLVGIDLDGGFAEYICVNSSMVYKVPDSIRPEHATLIEILGIGFHACSRANIGKDNTLAIFGAGRVGQSILQAARTRTTAPAFVVDILDDRLKIIDENFENVRTINALNENAAQVIQNESQGGVDIAFEAVGHAERLDRTIQPVLGCAESIRGGGKICVLGLSDEPVPVVFKKLIWKEAKIITSRVSHGEFSEVIEALAADKLKPDAMITEIVPADQTQQAFERIIKAPQEILKILLDFNTKK